MSLVYQSKAAIVTTRTSQFTNRLENEENEETKPEGDAPDNSEKNAEVEGTENLNVINGEENGESVQLQVPNEPDILNKEPNKEIEKVSNEDDKTNEKEEVSNEDGKKKKKKPGRK